MTVASVLQDEIPDTQVYLDRMDNAASLAYGAWPERLYVLLDGVVEYEGGKGPFLYNLDELDQWLESFSRKETGKLSNNNNDKIISSGNNNNIHVMKSKIM
eukprot:Seg476.10 transcript_id=Seg476.10/GoldUCD/mRNA.D3Y31 product="Thyroxine 5-deiodinase" protein_id=Seg476.10/GoldUCD/D3Y31